MFVLCFLFFVFLWLFLCVTRRPVSWTGTSAASTGIGALAICPPLSPRRRRGLLGDQAIVPGGLQPLARRICLAFAGIAADEQLCQPSCRNQQAILAGELRPALDVAPQLVGVPGNREHTELQFPWPGSRGGRSRGRRDRPRRGRDRGGRALDRRARRRERSLLAR